MDFSSAAQSWGISILPDASFRDSESPIQSRRNFLCGQYHSGRRRKLRKKTRTVNKHSDRGARSLELRDRPNKRGQPLEGRLVRVYREICGFLKNTDAHHVVVGDHSHVREFQRRLHRQRGCKRTADLCLQNFRNVVFADFCVWPSMSIRVIFQSFSRGSMVKTASN